MSLITEFQKVSDPNDEGAQLSDTRVAGSECRLTLPIVSELRKIGTGLN